MLQSPCGRCTEMGQAGKGWPGEIWTQETSSCVLGPAPASASEETEAQRTRTWGCCEDQNDNNICESIGGGERKAASLLCLLKVLYSVSELLSEQNCDSLILRPRRGEAGPLKAACGKEPGCS